MHILTVDIWHEMWLLLLLLNHFVDETEVLDSDWPYKMLCHVISHYLIFMNGNKICKLNACNPYTRKRTKDATPFYSDMNRNYSSSTRR